MKGHRFSDFAQACYHGAAASVDVLPEGTPAPVIARAVARFLRETIAQLIQKPVEVKDGIFGPGARGSEHSWIWLPTELVILDTCAIECAPVVQLVSVPSPASTLYTTSVETLEQLGLIDDKEVEQAFMRIAGDYLRYVKQVRA